MKNLYTKIKRVEDFLNSYLEFFFVNGNKQDRISNYYENKRD